jgi:LacI family transcriptional regulator
MAAVSVREVAALAGVSVGTVSNVLNRPAKVAAPTADRVHAAIRALGFVRNDAARQLRDGRSRAIGLVVLDVGNPFFTDLARGAGRRAASEGLSVLLASSDERGEKEASYLDLFEEQRVRGVLISPVADITPRLDRLRQRGIQVVLIDRISHDDDLSSVSVDDVAGGMLAAEHLLARGRNRLAFVGGPLGIRQAADRLEGARTSVQDRRGATLEVIEVDTHSVINGRRAGEHIAARAASDRPDAIFAANDLLATGLLQALHQRAGIAVPDEIALIGYDDIDFTEAAAVPLSSIRQPSALIGETATTILLEEAEESGLAPRHVVFQPELVVRASS